MNTISTYQDEPFEYVYTLGILIPSLLSREQEFNELMNEIEVQESELYNPMEIQVFTNIDDGEFSIGTKRNTLIEEATELCEYVCFLDDDDWIEPNYFASILQAIYASDEKPDLINITMCYYLRNQLVRRYIVEGQSTSHLCPVKSEIARKFKFSDSSSGEDVEWANKIRPHLKSQRYAPNAVYSYYHNPDKIYDRGNYTITEDDNASKETCCYRSKNY